MRFKILLVATLSVAPAAAPGQVSKSFIGYGWESTDCYRPYPPSILELDEFAISRARSYLNDVERYRSCVEEEASSDYSENVRKLATAIEEGRDEAIDEVDRDVDSLMRRIELLR